MRKSRFTTRASLPHDRTTLLAGGPGSGMAVVALQLPAHGARECNASGILVTFEETSQRIEAKVVT